MSAITEPVHHTLDTTGLLCPEPIMLLHQTMRSMQVGDQVTVLATDPSTQRDIPKFCEFLNCPLLETQHADEQFIYIIEKTAQ